jgi:ABC-type lipoprotein export system ATPase subunit
VITRIVIENFKRFDKAELELGDSVVLIGPNNSGKTTALQALALWDIGWRRWSEKRQGGTAEKRTGVTINRRDLTYLPVPNAKLLWHNLRTHFSEKAATKSKTQNVYITIRAEGVAKNEAWHCVLEFYYANEESFYCRLKESSAEETLVPDGARAHSLVYLPPMSGLAEREYRKEPGEISVLIGEGQTAQVLRNLCWQLSEKEDKRPWEQLLKEVRRLFNIQLQNPQYIKERSEITLSYKEASGIQLDLASAGRGCQQVILLLSYLLANPGAILLLDEPDAHLEILRQRDIFNLLTDIAQQQHSQVIAASHSEVVLKEAADRHVVLAFVGSPHRIDTQQGRNQLRKALESIHMADYYLAEQKGWILYLEGATDLAILRQLSQRLDHEAKHYLADGVPVQYLGHNQPQSARDHFYGLREAKPDLSGIALFDRLDRDLHTESSLVERQWTQREIENYVTTRESILGFCESDLRDDDLVELSEKQTRRETMERCIGELEAALQVTAKPDPWGPDIKVTDDFLDPLFKRYYEQLGTPQLMFKRDYHGLARTIPVDQIDPEVTVILNEIVVTAKRARPRQ